MAAQAEQLPLLPSPRPEVKIEKIQPKVETVDSGENFELREDSMNNFVGTTEFSKPGPSFVMTPLVHNYGMTSEEGNNSDSVAHEEIHCFPDMNLVEQSSQGDHVCSYCDKWLPSESALYNHMTRECSKQSQSQKTCPFCSFSTEFLDDMLSHVTLKHRVPLGPEALEFQTGQGKKLRFQCLICSKEISRRKDFEQHIFSEHNEIFKVRLMRCATDGSPSQTKTNLSSPERPTVRICKKCGKSLNSSGGYWRHTQNCGRKPNEIVKFKCFHCSRETREKWSLKRHIAAKHPVEPIVRPVCGTCRKSYKNECYLQRHMKNCGTNKKIEKFKCPLCSHESKNKADLPRHISSRHSDQAMVRLVCERCGRSYKNKYSLQQHMRFCEVTNNSIVKFKCFHCFHETKYKCGLKDHIAVKHPIGPRVRVVCRGCRKTYKHKCNLNQHLRYCENTTGELVKLKCSHCSFDTFYEPALKHHIAAKHLVSISSIPTLKSFNVF